MGRTCDVEEGAVDDDRRSCGAGVKAPGAWLVYDGGCPICKRYVRHLDVDAAVCELALVNARDGGALVEEIEELSHDLNDGIVLKMGGRYHVGGDAFRMLARLSTAKGLFGFANRLLFRWRWLARLTYPLLAAGRRVLLRLLNIPLLGERGDIAAPRGASAPTRLNWCVSGSRKFAGQARSRADVPGRTSSGRNAAGGLPAATRRARPQASARFVAVFRSMARYTFKTRASRSDACERADASIQPGWSTRRRMALGCGLACALLASWLLIAYGWMPLLLESGYRREGALLSDLFAGRRDNPFEHYLGRWHEVARLGTFWCVVIAVGGLFWRRVWAWVPWFFERFVGAATPGTLGAIRAWTCAILCYHTLFHYGLAGTALLPEVMVRPMGVMAWLRWLPFYDAFLANPMALRAFQYATALLLLLGAVGLGTRIVVPLAAVAYLVVAGIERQFSFFNHGGIVPWYVLAVLCCTRCDRGFSLDRLWRRARGRSVLPGVPLAEFGWARYAVWATVAAVYLMAGLSKLYGTGLGWVAADNMRAHLLRPLLKLPYNDAGMLFSVLPAPDLLFVLLGAATLCTQLVFGFVLVSRMARLALPAAMILVHIGIWRLMDIQFIDLMLLLLVFYDWRALRLAVRQRLPTRARPLGAPASSPSGERAARVHRRGAITTLAIAATAASVWIAQVTFYPLSSIPLFIVAESPTGSVQYERLIAHYEDGTSGEPPLDEWFGSIGAFRFRPVVGAAFSGPRGREQARQFLDAAAHAARLQNHLPRPIRFEIQLRHYDFARDTHHADRAERADRGARGVIVDRYVHVVP